MTHNKIPGSGLRCLGNSELACQSGHYLSRRKNFLCGDLDKVILQTGFGIFKAFLPGGAVESPPRYT